MLLVTLIYLRPVWCVVCNFKNVIKLCNYVAGLYLHMLHLSRGTNAFSLISYSFSPATFKPSIPREHNYWILISSSWCLSGKESTSSAGTTGDAGSILGSGRFPEGGNGNPLQYSCLENPLDRGAWQATVHGVTKGQT